MAAGENPPAGASGGVEVDRERGEIRFPCWFVNPDRRLEVFACHESGPTHETVVAFRAGGEEIYRALQEAGFRGPEFWNVTSPANLRLTGGDRAVVWLRWEWKGKLHEVPAEEILSEESTQIPLFLRGFSFAAEETPGGDGLLSPLSPAPAPPGTVPSPPQSPRGGTVPSPPKGVSEGTSAGTPRRRVPTSVEFTIGGQSRQSAAFSMLYHPNDLPVMVNWAPVPEVSARAVPELRAMVESGTPATLIIRRLKSETELVELALGRESDPERRQLRELQRPLSLQIDAAKRDFEALGGEVKALLEEGERRKALGEEERRNLSARIQGLIARGGRIAAEVRELYLRLWDLEEAHRCRRSERQRAPDAGPKAFVPMAYRSGFRFELAIAGKLREIAVMAAGGQGVPADREGLYQRAFRAEIEALEAERERRWARFKLNREIRPRLKELDPQEDPYVTQLFRESELRALADMRALRAAAENARIEARELRARAAASSRDPAQGAGKPAIETPDSAWRARAGARARLAKAEREDVDLQEKIRWAQNPPGGIITDVDAGEETRRLLRTRAALGEQIRSLRAALQGLTGGALESAEAPPEDPERFYPEDVK